MTKQEIEEEEKKERSFNILSESIIGLTGWGEFYPLMKMASKMGEGQVNHRICVDAEGRNIKVYNTQAGKVIGTFLKPAHEQAAQYYGQKKYGKGILSLFGFGWYFKLKEQKDALCVVVKPDDVIARKSQIEKKLRKIEAYTKDVRNMTIGLIFIIVLSASIIIYLINTK